MSYCIWVDCDEVLCETIDELLKLPKFKNNNITKEDITSYYLRDIEKLNLTKDEGIHLFFSFFDSPEFYNTKPVKYAYETLTKRKKEWNKLIVVTARAEQFQEQTIKRININFPNIFSDFLFMNQFKDNEKSKSELCKEKWIQLLIDDSINNLLDVNSSWIPWILLDKPRNRNIKDTELLKRAKSRSEINISKIFNK